MSRVLAGKLKLNLHEINLLDVINAAADALLPRRRTRTSSARCGRGPHPLRFPADPARLQQVFWNLLSNAIKFTPPSGHVVIVVAASDTEASVQIIDNGCGIHADLLPFVFDRFRQGDGETARGRGLGLGLSLVRDLTRAHRRHGDCSKRRRRPWQHVHGRAPAGACNDRRDLSTGADGNVAGDVAPGAFEHDVLIVDDEPGARELLALMLKTRGASVRTAASAAEGLEAMALRPPDLVLSDIGMPEEDGYSFMRTWRARERERGWSRVPAIAVTAYAGPRD